jgi:hypothetical protein|tara:strand:- start:2707 stop:3117 length:411 start_codon:yes stop_codon:yes gene_type:complete
MTEHSQGIPWFPNVSIPKDRNVYVLNELGDCIPIGVSRVKVPSGSGVQSDCGASRFLGDSATVKKCQVIVIDSLAKLDSYRDLSSRLNRGFDDGSQQMTLHRNCCATTVTSHFRSRATKVHVKVIDVETIFQHPNS